MRQEHVAIIIQPLDISATAAEHRSMEGQLREHCMNTIMDTLYKFNLAISKVFSFTRENNIYAMNQLSPIF